MTTQTEETFDVLKWITVADIHETPAPGTSPEAPGGPSYGVTDEDDDESDEEDDEDWDEQQAVA